MTAGRSLKPCIFCIEKINYVDYKNLGVLRFFISRYGKIIPRYYTGVCLRHQKRVTRAIKRAREMAILPFVR
ncbi:MAG: 30S ribosomal protein S18 [Candidatus Peregrinibacteria bacterium GW2011_GWA2_47_7]|nr:MAG: 30S ribosomal protein S18 [Candidatus Peregrinibacteria bacterium GW2011_GWA2_47_7]